MKKRIIISDLKSNKLLTFSTLIFMALSALLFALTCFLFTGLTSSIDVLMEKAKTPDFLQMHSGEIDEDKLASFADNRDDIESYQIINFLNLDNGSISLADYSLSNSNQDNGVIMQCEAFDYLVDMDNNIISVKDGEIYVPVCYLQEYKNARNTQKETLTPGDSVKIGSYSFKLAGFLRDSQMNSMMSSSKRFLVSENDFEKLRPSGSEEYLIEYLLKEGADVNAFSTAYQDAALPANGPAITKPLIKMMNALSDGIMIFVILLVSIVMLFISMLCIRFTLLDKITSDKREIGMLKAVGISRKDIRGIYFYKYIVLSAISTVLGLIIAFIAKIPLQKGMQELYGIGKNSVGAVIAAIAGVVLTQGMLLLSIAKTIKRTEKMSAVEALLGKDSTDSGRRSYALIAFVIAAGVFLMAVPKNMYSTISSEKFVTYMGIGNSDVRIDIRQTEDILKKTSEMESLLKDNADVKNYASFITKNYRISLSDGTESNVNIEQGDHTKFPLTYVSGSAPVNTGEIAVSYLFAKDMDLSVGDKIDMYSDGNQINRTVCGIYSDLTNGGKTAKSAFLDDSMPVMWSVFYVAVNDKATISAFVETLDEMANTNGINAKIVDVKDFVLSIYGQTMQQIRLASNVAILSAIIVIIVVVFLFTRLMMSKDRTDISFRKAIGFVAGDIKLVYAKKYTLAGIIGIVSGIILGNILGEAIAGVMLNSLGASGFEFIINAFNIYILIPLIMVATVCAAMYLGLREINKIHACECCYDTR